MPIRRIMENGGGGGGSTYTVQSVYVNPLLFSDPKLNAMRQAAVAGNFAQLFSIAPRGCVGPVGPTLSDRTRGICSDDLTMPIGSRAGQMAYDYWIGQNPLRKNLAINDLRYRKNADGKIFKVPFTKAEIIDYHQNYHLSRGDWFCELGQLQDYINKSIAGRALWPMDFCAEPSRRRHREIIKKVAIAGAVITAGVFLAPTLAGGTVATGTVATGTGGALTAAGGAAIPGVVGAGGGAVLTAAAGSGAAAAVSTATFWGSIASGTDTLLKYVDKARTVDAIIKGEMPPPPIDVSGAAFQDWAIKAAENEFAEQMQRRMTAKEEQQLRVEIADLQRRMAAIPIRVPMAPSQDLSSEAREKILQMQAIEKDRSQNTLTLLALVAGAFLLAG